MLCSDPALRSTGKITFSLAGVNVEIQTTDIVGNVLQSWFGEWLKSRAIYFRTRPNTQEFPDFILDPNNDIGNLLELKSFNYSAGPAFDIANFESYCTSLQTNAYRLNADYLVFGYTMNGSHISISQIWLKKIWELTSTSSNHAIRVQDKRGTIYNIRPTTFYSNRATPPFSCKEDFVIALYKTIKNYSRTSINADFWFDTVQKSYYSYYNEYLNISKSDLI